MFRKGRAVGVMFHLEVSAEAVGRWAREGETAEFGRMLIRNCLDEL